MSSQGDILIDIQHIRRDLYPAAKNKDFDTIKNILSNNIYPNVPLEKKEKTLLRETLMCIHRFNEGNEILSYLIFDYKINEERLDYDFFRGVNVEKALEMFNLRNALELNQELSLNPKITNKKPKV
jgi:hypothetical protein